MPVAEVEIQVEHVAAVLETDALGGERIAQRLDEGVVLVVLAELHHRHVLEAPEAVHEAVHVALHLQQRLPVVEGEHGAPEEPEVGGEELGREVLVDRHTLDIGLAGEEQLDQLAAHLGVQAEAGVVLHLPVLVDQSAVRPVRVDVVDVVELVEHRVALAELEGGHVGEEIPEAVVPGLHLASATQDVARLGRTGGIDAATGDLVHLQDGDVLPGDVAVTDRDERSCQGGEAAADGEDPAVFDTGGRQRTVTVVVRHLSLPCDVGALPACRTGVPYNTECTSFGV